MDNNNQKPAKQLSSSVLSFSTRLFETMISKNNTDNICASPISIALCFAMLIEGANKNTRNELMTVLGFTEDYLAHVEAFLRNIKSSASLIKIANSLWMTDRKKLDSTYKDVVLNSFVDAELSTCDFIGENQRSIDYVNRWIEKKTEGHIRNVVKKIVPETLLILVNAIYFEAEWIFKFDASDTRGDDFNLLDNASKVRTTMMHLEPSNCYVPMIATSQFKAVSLPYTGNDTCMFVILPSANTTAEYEHVTSAHFLKEFFTVHRHTMKKSKVELSLPKFKFDSNYELIPLLQSLGLQDLFDQNKADLSKLTQERNSSFVSDAIHSTFIQVDEEGTKAAAMTKVDARSRSAGPRDYEVFNVNRPFVFAVFHHPTEQILFIGRLLTVEPYSSVVGTKRGRETDREDEHRGRSIKKYRRQT